MIVDAFEENRNLWGLLQPAFPGQMPVIQPTASIYSQHKEEQESPAVADKPARRLRKVCTVYVRAVGL